MTRLASHALHYNGRAFWDANGILVSQTDPGFYYVKRGCALCECGATSPVLDSDAARKRWHRDHKTEMTKAAQT